MKDDLVRIRQTINEDGLSPTDFEAEPDDGYRYAFPVRIEKTGRNEKGEHWLLPEYKLCPPGLKTVVFTEQMLREIAPDLLKMTYPRVYERCETYHSPRTVGVMLAQALHTQRLFGINACPTTFILMAPAMKPLIERQVPLMFLAPAFLEAVRNTDFHDEINWSELELPYEEGIFVLPRGALIHPVDGEVAFIMWSRQRAGVHKLPFRDRTGKNTIELPGDRFSFVAGCPYADNMVWFDSNITAEKRPILKFGHMFYGEDGSPQLVRDRMRHQDFPLESKDHDFLETIGKLLFGSLMALNARPQLQGRSDLIRSVPAKKDRDPLEFWSPNVIGQNYQVKRPAGPPLGGTHSSPRLHWRRGHHRNQPCGPQWSERRWIWIEPVLIEPREASGEDKTKVS
jgi:hypothetical protein